MPRLSAIVITRNEERQIQECLESIHWVDEIIVVDSGSTDRTVELALEHATRVIETTWQGYAKTKALALAETTSEWVLWIDTDERVTLELGAEIRQAIEDVGIAGYYVARKTIFLGRWIRHCGWYPDYVCRLFRRDRARFNEALVHEAVEVDGQVEYLEYPLIHHTDPTLEHYLNKFNVYTSLAAKQLNEKGKRFHLFDLLLRPPFTFVKMYIIKLGFLDGIQGLILCVLSSCYVFTKYAKLWHVWHTRKS